MTNYSMRQFHTEDHTMRISPKNFVCISMLPLAAAAILVIGLQHRHLQADPPKPPVNKPLSLPGHAEAFELVDLHVGVAGFIKKVNVDIGDRVKKGDVLAELSAPDLEAEYKLKLAVVEQAKAEVEVAHRSIQAARAALESAKLHILEAEAAVKSAQANLKLHATHLERMKSLLANAAIDQAMVDEATQQVEAAKAGLEAAEARLLTVKANVLESEAQVARAEAMTKVAEARVTVAKADAQRTMTAYDFTKVTAPFDGIVTRRTASTGDFAQAAANGKPQPFFVVARTDVVRMAVQVPESEVARLTIGTPAVIHFAALKDQEFKGKLTRVGGSIDRTNGTLRTEIDLPNADGKILPGMYGTVTLGK
jgi:HlyD family secretion protein